jgi:hypothetical protein
LKLAQAPRQRPWPATRACQDDIPKPQFGRFMPIKAQTYPIIECKLCASQAQAFGAADFSRAAGIDPLPTTGKIIYYYRCIGCGFLFTDAFDEWENADFLREIYNDDYIRVDPDFVRVRPLQFADEFTALTMPQRERLRILDYGGGAGVFTHRLRETGFHVWSHDPFFRTSLEPKLGEKFELIHCREVMEHSADPRSFVFDLLRFLDREGAVYISTLVQPDNIAELGLSWWYAAPRNGHISLFSRESLGSLWQQHGLNFHSFDDLRHIAWRGNPPCLTCFIRPPEAATATVN